MFNYAIVENFPILSRLDKFIEPGSYIAGGVFKNLLEGKPFRDVDVYFVNKESHDSAVAKARANGLPLVYENDRVTAFKVNDVTVEYIRYAYGPPLEMISTFDFTITKMAYGYSRVASDPFGEDFEEEPVKQLVHHDKFFEHLHQRRLVIEDRLLMPLSTFERTYKYTRYGFNLCRDSKVRLLQQIIDTGAVDGSELSASLYAGMD